MWLYDVEIIRLNTELGAFSPAETVLVYAPDLHSAVSLALEYAAEKLSLPEEGRFDIGKAERNNTTLLISE